MILDEIKKFFDTVQSELAQTVPVEIFCAFAIPLVAALIGVRIKRYVVQHPQKGVWASILDYIAPLIGPAIAIGTTMGALFFLRHSGIESPLLVYVLKLCTAWIAVALVMVMSAKRTSGWFIALVIIPITLLHMFDLWDMTTEGLESVAFSVGTAKLNLYIIMRGIVLILLLQWLASGAVTLVDRRLNKVHDLRASSRALIMKIFQIVLYCFAFLFAMQMLGISLAALGVFGGALGVGLGFGLQKIASNFISGIILLFEKSIEIGDLVELQDGTLGYVRQTYARYTRLEMTNGKELFIPNEEFISQRVISWTHTNNKAQVDIVIGVGYDTDIPFAQKLMIDIANGNKSRLPGSEATCYMTAFGDNAIELKLQFWVKDILEGRQAPRSEIMLHILEAFRKHEISIPYPQREVRLLNPPEPVLVEKPSTPEAKPKLKKKLPLKEMP